MASKKKGKVAAVKPEAKVQPVGQRVTRNNVKEVLGKRWENLTQVQKLDPEKVAEKFPRLYLWAVGQGLAAVTPNLQKVARECPRMALRHVRKHLSTDLQRELRMPQLARAAKAQK